MFLYIMLAYLMMFTDLCNLFARIMPVYFCLLILAFILALLFFYLQDTECKSLIMC